jgi:hypothetical protein
MHASFDAVKLLASHDVCCKVSEHAVSSTPHVFRGNQEDVLENDKFNARRGSQLELGPRSSQPEDRCGNVLWSCNASKWKRNLKN